jgi:hypothetical protein
VVKLPFWAELRSHLFEQKIIFVYLVKICGENKTPASRRGFHEAQMSAYLLVVEQVLEIIFTLLTLKVPCEEPLTPLELPLMLPLVLPEVEPLVLPEVEPLTPALPEAEPLGFVELLLLLPIPLLELVLLLELPPMVLALPLFSEPVIRT